jgi:hypothetical protein
MRSNLSMGLCLSFTNQISRGAGQRAAEAGT